ncbi:tRNA-binding protein [Komagataeibacter swingsii]|uniref:tRNA-binding protein n=1 Tax=Komagataeibacter swingsii TaxID=215220 RepID=A0A2V4R5M1_9PROT|nr:tRNA-binding protein [Komagataeibacter swingsii]AHI25937.1 export-related chaperone CsaA [Komagataeibacter xylinus E25]RFP06062.1 tRNA-binding protein [Komagataeibacter xylinus]NVN36925.1 tRNA-binding protein [Komagataeibacter swingsii]PYD71413.1 tRNA-binding protein [Komagataeibacter swingsii]RFP06566.1 tRNA-binding protein [Komagataeibacter xylinus]
MTDPVEHAAVPGTEGDMATRDWLDIRAGTVVAAHPVRETPRHTFRLTIDFGPHIGIRSSVVQVNHRYVPARLVGRQICAVINVPPRQVGSLRSEVLTLGMPDSNGEAVLIRPDGRVPDGGKLF